LSTTWDSLRGIRVATGREEHARERRKGFRGRERSWGKLRESLWRENARERSTAQREKDKARPTEKDKEIKK